MCLLKILKNPRYLNSRDLTNESVPNTTVGVESLKDFHVRSVTWLKEVADMPAASLIHHLPLLSP